MVDKRRASLRRSRQLGAHGVDASRLRSMGYGESKPLVPNRSATSRAPRIVAWSFESSSEGAAPVKRDGHLSSPQASATTRSNKRRLRTGCAY